jgi:diguanylate cyclase (GGDEF)-like protein
LDMTIKETSGAPLLLSEKEIRSAIRRIAVRAGERMGKREKGFEKTRAKGYRSARAGRVRQLLNLLKMVPRTAHRRLSREPRAKIVLWALLTVATLGIIDLRTGPEISFSIFYLAPVALAAWYVSHGAAIAISFAAAATWLAADLLSGNDYSHAAIPIWNSAVRFGFFVTLGCLASTIRKRLDEEEHLADTDCLTALANARSFYEKVETEIVRQRRYRNPFTLAYLDLDNFKEVNDRWGHDVGDDLLMKVARVLEKNTRASDISARLGGDEFAVLFPMTDAEGARSAVSALQEHLLDCMVKNLWPVTFSVGVVTFLDTPRGVRQALKTADDRMYSAKRAGKNCVAYEDWSNEADPLHPVLMRLE